VSHRATSSLILAAIVVLAACGPTEEPEDVDTPTGEVEEPEPTPSPAETIEEVDASTDAEALPDGVTDRPEWLGTRVLPERPDGLGEVQPTPPELEDRRLPPPDDHPLPPPEDVSFSATVDPVPDDVLQRSTWHEDCPVAVDDLRYLTVTFWGFDERVHTGEIIVHADVADDVVDVFARIHEARFPIEEMRVVTAEELDLPPTGDGNNSTGFVCRSKVSGGTWSEHAYGRAIDINPFHNPYERGDVVVPELASAYTDRGWQRPGMILDGDEVVEAFGDIGWGWGGDWTSAKDPMHFSVSGR
jgi:hypothetical protein